MSHRGSDKVVRRKAVRVTACNWDICRHSDASSAWMPVDSETCACSQHEDATASLRDTVDRASRRTAEEDRFMIFNPKKGGSFFRHF